MIHAITEKPEPRWEEIATKRLAETQHVPEKIDNR